MRWSGAWLLTILVGAAVLGAVACGGSSQSCAQGAKSCPCRSDSTCNAGLSCLSKVCVNAGGTGGGGGGGQGGTAGGGATGGSSSGGGGGTTGGGGGGATSGSGGAMCGNTTTDPQNCGSCGHVCKSSDPTFGGCPTGGCCAAGKCGPYPAPCITQPSGFTNCNDYCASIGETCVQRGCVRGGVTSASWSEAGFCESLRNPAEGYNMGTCDLTIGWDSGAFRYVRCCCTDTH
jgi:hypothetical protein